MELNIARKIALENMDKHGLSKDYRFKFIDSVNTCGRCTTYGFCSSTRKPSKRKGGFLGEISLSKKFVLNNSDEEVMDTILHEIAHALCNMENGLVKRNGKVIHHGFEWRRWAIKVGAKPNTCAGNEVYIPKKYKLICSNDRCLNFEKTIAEKDKQNSGKYRCKRCKTRLSWKINLNSGGDSNQKPVANSSIEIFS